MVHFDNVTPRVKNVLILVGLTDQISDLMTTDEYDKLYKAIGYEETNESTNSLPTEVIIEQNIHTKQEYNVT